MASFLFRLLLNYAATAISVNVIGRYISILSITIKRLLRACHLLLEARYLQVTVDLKSSIYVFSIVNLKK